MIHPSQQPQQVYISQPAQPQTLLQVPPAIEYYKNGRPNKIRTLKRSIKREVYQAINNWQQHCDNM